MRRTVRLLTMLAALCTAGMVFQTQCIATGINLGLAGIDFCALLGPDCTLGPIAPCGNPDNPFDNLLVDCPGTIIIPTGGGGGGGTGGGGTGGGGGFGGGGTGGGGI